MQIIVNADDFGRSTAINKAVIQAHREGVLTSASLMVTGDAVEEAVALAKETPSLAVGLHLVLAEGRAILPPEQIPHLVNGHGHFPDSGARAGLRYALNRTVRQELAQELVAQFERFAATGLPLSHVDGHLHMHLVPGVVNLVLPLAEKYGARGFRLPRDDLWMALRHDRRGAGTKVAWALAFALLCRWCLPALTARSGDPLRHRRLVVTHRVYGVMETGQMEETYVVKVLRELSAPTAELYFHPTIGPNSEALGPNAGDLATLLSPAVRQVIEERGLRLTTYLALKEE